MKVKTRLKNIYINEENEKSGTDTQHTTDC